MLRDERGVYAVSFAILLPLFLALAALAIDMSYAYKVRNTTQVTASAAALAGVSQLNDANGNDDPNDDDADGNDSEDYRREAIEYAYRNMSPAVHGNVVSATCGSYDSATDEAGTDDLECGDIKAGHWDGSTFHAWDDPGYIPAVMKIDALQVGTHRAEVNANPLQLFFAAALGMAETDINTAAVATTGGGEITNGCLVALNNDDGEDQTFYINGTASVTAVGCDIRVDQCCALDGGEACKQGALRANGTPQVMVESIECPVPAGDCEPYEGKIDVCGTVRMNDGDILDPAPFCDDPEGALCQGPGSGDSYDPMSQYAEDHADAWSDLNGEECHFNDFDVTKLSDPSYEYYREDGSGNSLDAVLDTSTGQWTYYLHPGVYCSDGKKNSKAIKFSGGASDPKFIFSNEASEFGWPAGTVNEYTGVYVIKNGKLDLASTGNISCAECGFYLVGDPATMDITGNNDLTLSASSDPDSPLYSLLIYQDTCSTPGCDPLTPEDQEIKIAGGNDGSYNGAIYVPNADIWVTGNTTSYREATDCLVIIADEFSVEGGAQLNVDGTCSNFNGLPFSPAPLFFTLVN